MKNIIIYTIVLTTGITSFKTTFCGMTLQLYIWNNPSASLFTFKGANIRIHQLQRSTSGLQRRSGVQATAKVSCFFFFKLCVCLLFSDGVFVVTVFCVRFIIQWYVAAWGTCSLRQVSPMGDQINSK